MNPEDEPTTLGVLRRSLPAILLATVLLVPFLGKAFTIDDTVFLFEARHAFGDPLHPTAFELPWNKKPERVSAIVPTGPVMAWLLVPAVLSPNPEILAHLLQLGMVWMAILATVGLALRLGVPSAWAAAAGLLVGVAPAVLGMAGTAMPDVPAMALGVAGLERLMAWRNARRIRRGSRPPCSSAWLRSPNPTSSCSSGSARSCSWAMYSRSVNGGGTPGRSGCLSSRPRWSSLQWPS